MPPDRRAATAEFGGRSRCAFRKFWPVNSGTEVSRIRHAAILTRICEELAFEPNSGVGRAELPGLRGAQGGKFGRSGATGHAWLRWTAESPPVRGPPKNPPISKRWNPGENREKKGGMIAGWLGALESGNPVWSAHPLSALRRQTNGSCAESDGIGTCRLFFYPSRCSGDVHQPALCLGRQAQASAPQIPVEPPRTGSRKDRTASVTSSIVRHTSPSFATIRA